MIHRNSTSFAARSPGALSRASAFAALARAGNNLVIADVISEVLLTDYCHALQGLNVYLIRVHCSLKTLEDRERAQKNRTAGGARMQSRERCRRI